MLLKINEPSGLNVRETQPTGNHFFHRGKRKKKKTKTSYSNSCNWAKQFCL